MIKGFKDFIMRGNVIDLAVAVVIGVAIGDVIDRIVSGIINPLIAMLGGQPNLSSIVLTINNAEFRIGSVLDALITFVLIAAAVYFVIVLPMNKLIERRKAGEEPEPEVLSNEEELLTEIRDLLKERS